MYGRGAADECRSRRQSREDRYPQCAMSPAHVSLLGRRTGAFHACPRPVNAPAWHPASVQPLDPEELEAAGAPAGAEIAAATMPGPVHLTVADLGRSLAYYEHAIGLSVRHR